jgi:hypothetical protein
MKECRFTKLASDCDVAADRLFRVADGIVYGLAPGMATWNVWHRNAVGRSMLFMDCDGKLH